MRRTMLISAAVLSLLLCVAVCVLWVRSGRRSDYAAVAPKWRHFVCMSVPGGLKLSTWPRPVQPGGWRFASYEYGVRNAYGAWMDPPAMSWTTLGFGLRPLQFSNQSQPDRGAFELCVPFWFLAAGLAALPLFVVARLTRVHRRERQRRCTHCDYDLRASPGRCPECGTNP